MLSQHKTQGMVAGRGPEADMKKATTERAKGFGLKESEGALVGDVMENSPAEKVDLRRGDIIISFDGKKIKDMDTLPKLVGSTEIGKKVKIAIIRDGKTIEKEIVIGELKDESMQISRKPTTEKDFGIVVQDITPEIAIHMNLKDKKGVIVTDIQPGSPAQEADIRSGDVIREIGRKPIRNVSDFKAAMKSANIKEGIVVLIKRENTTFYAVLRQE